ncbi:MAG: 23S rRNA (guanosine(2251)-2'-O)-methyltransferase RlmB [Bacilli bacterium]
MYIYGKNVVYEKLKSDDLIKEAFVFKKFSDQEIIDLLKMKKIDIKWVDKYQLDKMVNGLHQGIILNVKDFDTVSLDNILNNDSRYPLIVMLDHLEDPHNFGAIIRSCEALGVDGIIIPNDRSVDINGTVIKTSAGAIQYMKIAKVSNLVNTIKVLKDKGYWIIGTDMNGTSYNDMKYDMPICLVIGNEGKGMSRLVKESCDYVVSIDMVGKTNSLNASVATGIMIAKIQNSRKL